ncbi:hypothetical protein [Corynebacterium renale]|nr:hypothetical protein [Corynebacterium renale]STD01175.1 Uncharacterised protein [Corynebacterium renale]STD70321.1 Uncharacterised protein [Corynebacterium renale]
MKKLTTAAATILLTANLLTPATAHEAPNPGSSQTELNQWQHDPLGALVWGIIKTGANILQSNAFVASVASMYAMGPIGPQTGAIAELTHCANTATSSNPTGAARYIGAAVCLLTNPGLQQRLADQATNPHYR